MIAWSLLLLTHSRVGAPTVRPGSAVGSPPAFLRCSRTHRAASPQSSRAPEAPPAARALVTLALSTWAMAASAAQSGEGLSEGDLLTVREVVRDGRRDEDSEPVLLLLDVRPLLPVTVGVGLRMGGVGVRVPVGKPPQKAVMQPGMVPGMPPPAPTLTAYAPADNRDTPSTYA